MNGSRQAARIDLFSLATPQMRAFHMTWLAFFLCFFAWFGIAPLMPLVREEFALTPREIGNLMIASVGATMVARLFFGWLCDRIGPRLAYTSLLIGGSLPVMTIGLATGYQSLLWFRLAIGVIGSSFVITQVHTALMFAPGCVGTANATTAGWGNLGGGAAQIVMPLLAAGLVWAGLAPYWSWRAAMLVAGVACLLAGVAYFRFTQDTPEGNFADLNRRQERSRRAQRERTLLRVCADARVWALFVAYAACFGIELTINNVAAIYYFDRFGLDLATAGLIAGLFGLMNLFARTLGGVFGDCCGNRWGVGGRVWWLFAALLVEGTCLLVFSRTSMLPAAVATMVVLSLFVQMAEGATYAVVPFIDRHALGSVTGIVGAGGNAGAIAGGFLFRTSSQWWPQAFWVLGLVVISCAFLTLVVLLPAASTLPAITRAVGNGVRRDACPASRVPAVVRVRHAHGQIDPELIAVVHRYTGLNRFRREFRA